MLNDRHSKQNTKMSAFTLLELLVVIAIISILMSAMMPTLSRVKEVGKSAVCLSNLRQFTIAWTTYTIENNDRLCAADTDWNGIPPWNAVPSFGNLFNNWVADGPGMPFNDFCGTETAVENGVLWPYAENLQLYKCKTDRNGFPRSYAISHAMGSIHNFNGEMNFYRSSQMTTPSQKVVFVDVRLSPQRSPTGTMGGVGSDGSFYPINTFTKTWRIGVAILTARHGRGCNMSFADGHSEPWKWQDERTIEVMQGGFSDAQLENYSVNNPDIPRLLTVLKGRRDRQWQ